MGPVLLMVLLDAARTPAAIADIEAGSGVYQADIFLPFNRA